MTDFATTLETDATFAPAFTFSTTAKSDVVTWLQHRT
jgi:hypothetical protein